MFKGHIGPCNKEHPKRHQSLIDGALIFRSSTTSFHFLGVVAFISNPSASWNFTPSVSDNGEKLMTKVEMLQN
jgi:hypothetical protein